MQSVKETQREGERELYTLQEKAKLCSAICCEENEVDFSLLLEVSGAVLAV